MKLKQYLLLEPVILICCLGLAACGGGGGGGGDSDDSDEAYKSPVVILDSNTLEFPFSAFAVADLNQDGFEDLVGKRDTGLVSGPAAEVLIMINDGKGSLNDETASFIDGAIPSLFLTRDLHLNDFNGDNRPDIFFSNQGKEIPGNFPCEQNALLLSQPDGRLKDATANIRNVADFSHGSSVGDIDKDGDLDIWVNNLGCNATVPSYLLQNDGNGVFTDIAGLDHLNGILPGGFTQSFWSQLFDFNSDGAADLFSTNLADAKLLLNNGAMPTPTFNLINNSTIPDGVGAVTTQHTEVFDVNADGLQDLVLFQTPDNFSPGHWRIHTISAIPLVKKRGRIDLPKNLTPNQRNRTNETLSTVKQRRKVLYLECIKFRPDSKRSGSGAWSSSFDGLS